MAEVRDVAIVGAGLLGLATARELTRRGRDVVVLEQATVGHEGAGSKGSCRIFRLGYPRPDYVAAARRAREGWHQLEAEAGRPLLLPTPHVTFGTGLPTVHAAMQQAGAPCELLAAAEVAAMFPAIRIGGPALLEPESCVIDSAAALDALAATVPEVRTNARVLDLADDGGRVSLRTDRGRVTARVAVITAGPATSGLLAHVGVPVPTRPTLEHVAYLAPAAGATDRAPIFICHDGQSPYGLPVPGGPLYKIGIHHSGASTDPDAQTDEPNADLVARLHDVARRYLPGYHPRPTAIERCVYDNTPDEDFVLDRVGNVVIGCGTSGHGFKFGPLLGEWLADLATGRTNPRMSSRFALARLDSAQR